MHGQPFDLFLDAQLHNCDSELLHEVLPVHSLAAMLINLTELLVVLTGRIVLGVVGEETEYVERTA